MLADGDGRLGWTVCMGSKATPTNERSNAPPAADPTSGALAKPSAQARRSPPLLAERQVLVDGLVEGLLERLDRGALEAHHWTQGVGASNPYSGIVSSEPPKSFGKSLNLGRPSRTASTFSP